MKSELPKVLHQVCGRPMLLHVLAAAEAVEAARTIVVLGHGSEQVTPHLPPGCAVAIQHQQRGTGHALLAAAGELPSGAVVVLPGDTPLVTGEVLRDLVEVHHSSGAAATVLTMILDDPTGYGRILRDAGGAVTRIVEHRDATTEERAICEVNTGMFVLPIPLALEVLETVGSDNDQGEIYLTDVISGLIARGERVAGAAVADPRLVLGVNSPVELAEAERIMGERIKARWMLEGAVMVDPASTLIEAGVTLSARVTVRPFTSLCGSTSVGPGSEVGPCSTLIDATIADNCLLPHCFVRSAHVEAGTRLEPFTMLDAS
jgi:bifunctional UDP-N-acetylglucosamine pyrophosphorylase/glucosamine-1-phosphate N-acetyltransferase